MRTSCIRLRAKSRIAVLYEDFLEILNGNMLAAMLLAILVYWTDIKIGKKDSNLWIWKSHTDFQDDLMFDKEGMKPPHRTTIKSALDLLVEKKFVYRRKNPKMPLDQTKQYLVDQTAVQAAIDALPPIVVLPTLESRNSDIALSNKQQSLSENQQCNAEIPTSNTSDYSTEITESVITEEREGVFASAPTAPSETPSENVYHFAGTQQQHLVWNCHTWCAANHATCEDYVAAIEAGLHERPTDKVPVVPPGNVTGVTYSQPVYKQGESPDGHLSQPARADVDSGSDERAVGGTEQEAINGQVAPMQQTFTSVPKSDGAAPTAPPCSEPRASEDIPPMAETAAQIRKRVDRRADDLLALYCHLMGDKVTRSKENMEAMRELAQLDRSDEEVTLVMRNILDDPDQFLARQLTPRKLATNFTPRSRTARGTTPTKRNGHAPPAQEEPERDYTGFDVYKGNGPEERAYYAAIGASLPDSYFDQ